MENKFSLTYLKYRFCIFSLIFLVIFSNHALFSKNKQIYKLQKVYSSKDTNDLLKLILFNKKLYTVNTYDGNAAFLDSNNFINLVKYPYLLDFEFSNINKKLFLCESKLSCKNYNLIEFVKFKIYQNDTAKIECCLNNIFGAFYEFKKENNKWKLISERYGIY